MASDNAVQQVKEFNQMIDKKSIPEDIRDVVISETYKYVDALRQVGAPPDQIQQYVANNIEMAKDIDLKPGALKKFLEEESMKSVQEVMQQRDAQQIQEMQQQQQHQQQRLAQEQMQQSLGGGLYG